MVLQERKAARFWKREAQQGENERSWIKIRDKNLSSEFFKHFSSFRNRLKGQGVDGEAQGCYNKYN